MANEGLFGLFSPGTGRALQRTGSALSGRLAQFDELQQRRDIAQREETQRLSAERKKALLLDNRQVRRMLEAGDTAGAVSLLQNRVQNIQQLGGDPKDTQGLLNQLGQDAPGALREVTLLDQRAVDEKLLPAFEGDTFVGTQDGQAIFRTPGGQVEARPITGLTGVDKKRKTAKDVEGVLRFIDTGEIAIPGEAKRIVAKQKRVAKETVAKISKETFDDAKDLRGEFTKASGEFVKIRDSFSRILRSVKDPSAAGDLSLIFNFMKMLDPGSVVRESEFATAANAANVPDRIRGLFNRVVAGERMAEGQRADFEARARSLFAGQSDIQKSNVDRFTKLANKFKLDPSLVVADLSAGLLPDTGTLTPEQAREKKRRELGLGK